MVAVAVFTVCFTVWFTVGLAVVTSTFIVEATAAVVAFTTAFNFIVVGVVNAGDTVVLGLGVVVLVGLKIHFQTFVSIYKRN